MQRLESGETEVTRIFQWPCQKEKKKKRNCIGRALLKSESLAVYWSPQLHQNKLPNAREKTLGGNRPCIIQTHICLAIICDSRSQSGKAS